MITLNFNTPLKDVTGKEHPTITLASTLSEYIGNRSKGQTLKLYGWHKTLQVHDPLVLDDADLEELKKLISDNEDMYVFAKGQLLEVIKNAE